VSPRKRVALSIGISTAMVVLLAALLPRIYLANDDIGFTEYLRKNTFTPWISPILGRAFGVAYQEAPGVPWFGLYQYAVIIATGAVLIHTCTELIDSRPGLGQVATLLGAIVMGASHAILVVGITWTTVSISALGTAVAAFIAHLLQAQAAKTPVSHLRALLYGLLFVSGYMLRLQGLGAVVVALAPLLGWTGLRFLQKRHFPRLTALIAFGIQNRIPQAPGWDAEAFNEFNNERGRIHGHAAYEMLDTRAPELLALSGWTIDEYRDFTSWLIIDENDYPLEKVERLLDTGGVPEVVSVDWSYRQLRGIFEDSSASVLLFLTAVVAGLLLVWLGVIDRFWGTLYGIGYFVFLVGVPLWMSAHFRFPQRVSLSFFTVGALGMFVFIARAVADRPADQEPAPAGDRRGAISLAVIALCLFVWTRHLIVWLDRDPWPYRDELQALEDRVTARGGFVWVYVQAGLVELDPLRAEPRGYDGLQGGWGTFSRVWYDTIARLGVTRGAAVLPAMVDNPEAYVLAQAGTREALEDWIRRKVGNPLVRLALVDGAAMPGGGRPELYRVTTQPLVPGSEEWRTLERDEWARGQELPGPPDDVDLPFHTVVFAAPYEQHISPVRHPAANLRLEPVDGGIRCTVTGATGNGCAITGRDGQFAGVRIPVHGFRGARFELRLLDSQNIVGFYVNAQTKTSRSIRWRWELSPEAQQFGFSGTVTLVPGYPAHRLALVVNTAKVADVHDLHVYIAVKPGTHAGFELRNLNVAETE
jgi:hypothetical protein